MTHDAIIHVSAETPAPVVLDVSTAAVANLPALTAEQTPFAEPLFAQPAEHQTVANVVGLWTSLLLLHDLAVEALTPEPPENETPPRDEGPPPDGDPPTP